MIARALIGLAVLFAAPVCAPVSAQPAKLESLSPHLFSILVNRIDADYALPVDHAALASILTQKARDLAQTPELFDVCVSQQSDENKGTASLLAISEPIRQCLYGDADNDLKAGLTAQLATLVLAELEGESLIGLTTELQSQSQDEQAVVSSETKIELQSSGCTLQISLPTSLEYRSANKFGGLIGEQDKPCAIVLDLRGSEGGALDDVVAIADTFLSEGMIVRAQGRNLIETMTLDASSGEELEGVPMAVLINEKTAAGSEIIAAALQDQGRAILIGERSAGRSYIRSVYPLGREHYFVLVSAEVLRPSGLKIHGLGVTPDCTIDLAGSALGRFAASLVRGDRQCPSPDQRQGS